jgi:nucleotide-binding universal stress UspA family protein
MKPNESPDIHPRAPKPPAGATPAAREHERAGSGGGVTPGELHVCFNCGGELVYPLDWCEEGLRHWRIVLRCPDCESRREGVFEQGAVEDLDDELDRATAALLSDLQRVTHANMAEEIDLFVRALDADLIAPSDF